VIETKYHGVLEYGQGHEREMPDNVSESEQKGGGARKETTRNTTSLRGGFIKSRRFGCRGD